MNIVFSKSLAVIFQVVIFSVFLYSAITKFIDIDVFVNNIEKSLFLNYLSPNYLAVFIVFFEFSIAVLFFFEKTIRVALFLSFFLLIIFTGYIILMFMYSPFMPCSCGGIIDSLTWEQHIVFNAVLIFLVLCLLYDKNRT